MIVRRRPAYWYSSARMAQLVGNGLLTFTHADANFNSLMPSETLVYFSNDDELLTKVVEFHRDDAKRRYWASRARDFFHREINATLYARYIVETAMEQSYSHEYVWAR